MQDTQRSIGVVCTVESPQGGIHALVASLCTQYAPSWVVVFLLEYKFSPHQMLIQLKHQQTQHQNRLLSTLLMVSAPIAHVAVTVMDLPDGNGT